MHPYLVQIQIGLTGLHVKVQPHDDALIQVGSANFFNKYDSQISTTDIGWNVLVFVGGESLLKRRLLAAQKAVTDLNRTLGDSADES